MKEILLITVILLLAFYLLKQKVYKPYAWKKAIKSKKHQLQLGSFIFSAQRQSNGSQSYEKRYFIFKVTEINGDYVRLSVVRKLSENETIVSGDFSTTAAAYKELRQTITTLTITPILTTDLYQGSGRPMTVNSYLLNKYQKIAQSRYYYEEIPEEKKNQPLPANLNELNYYLTLVYSKNEILKHGKLVPWSLNNSKTPQLIYQFSKNIDMIIN